MKIEISKEQLTKFYIEEKRKIVDIAKLLNCSTDTIKRRLHEYGLKYYKAYDKNLVKEVTTTTTNTITDEIKIKIKDLYLSGMSCKEIGNMFGKVDKTISYHLDKMGIKKRSQKKINQDDFEKLWNEGKSDLEIADFFGVKEITIKTFRTRGENAGKFNRTNYFSESDITLTNEQEQFILGSLLGDLSINFGNGKNAKLALVHSIKQEELFMKKVEILGNFMGSYRLYTPSPDKRTGKIYQTWRGNSKSHKSLNEIYNILYINGVKTVSQEYLNKINHPIALAYWFMDDGTYRGTLATHCFSESENDLLIKWMNDKWNISCTKQKELDKFKIYIKSESRFDFEKLIFPYVIPSMYYKLKFVDNLKAESV